MPLFYQHFGINLQPETQRYEADDLPQENNPPDIHGKAVYSNEPNHVEKFNYTVLDKDIQIGIAHLWGMRDAMEDRDAIGMIADEATQFDESDWTTVLENTISALQKKIKEDDHGSCLLVNVIHKDLIITVNVGDSTAFLVTIDTDDNATTCTRLNKILHKPTTKEEYERLVLFAKKRDIPIEEIVHSNNRLAGRFAISGAMGDNYFEKFGLRHEPDIYIDKAVIPSSGHAFVITACDGLTEPHTMENKIGKLVARDKNLSPEVIAKNLVLEALNEGSTDNISVIVTPLNLQDARVKYAAIFDGHGGDQVAEMLHTNFPTELQNQIEIQHLSKL